MTEEEKYWGCTPVVTAHMEARMKASREYAKMVSNDGETPAQRANRARDFESGAIWEEGYSKKHGWHPASEPPKEEEEVIAAGDYDITRAVFHEGEYYIARYYYDPKSLNCALNGVNYWCYPPEKDN